MTNFLTARDLELIEVALWAAADACDSPLTLPLSDEYRSVADKVATIMPREETTNE